jgi:hypothetical protein
MRREVPMILATIAALYTFVWQVSHHAWNTRWLTHTDLWRTFMMQTAILLGALNLSRLQINNIRRRREHWPFSVLCLVVLWGYMIFGMTAYGLFAGRGNRHPIYLWLHDGVMVPAESTMFSLLAFFIASAAFRAFKIRSREATVLMVFAFIVMLARVPVGQVMWARMPALGTWIMGWPTTAAMRGMAIGIFLGVFTATLRVFLGLERRYLGSS